MSLQGKVIVITGASAGIGRATALALAKERTSLVLTARRAERLEELRKETEALGASCLIVPADVSKEENVHGVINQALLRFGRIDVLVNNAGSGMVGTLEETTPEIMEKIWRTNFMSTFYGIRNVVPVMKKQGGGHIVTVSSVVGKRATPLNAAYCSTKFAQVGLMESARMELRKYNILCTLIYPGSTESEFLKAQENPGRRAVRRHGPVQTSDQVATKIVQAIKKPRPEVMTQSYGRILAILNSISPGLVDWFITRTVKRKELSDL
jgi:short-subunit dehydrogenase